MKVFKYDYDKSYFYSITGKFFAERKYKKLMPYLINDDEMIWNVIIDNGMAQGFISYKENGNRININYCYAEDKCLYEKLLKSLPNKKTFIELEKHFDKSIYEKIGYKIYKETVNYWYMELIIDEKIS